MLVEQQQKVCNLHFLVTSVWAAALSFLKSFNSTSCSAVGNCITGLLTTVVSCSSNTFVSLFGYPKSLLVQIQQRPKQRQRHKYFMIQLAHHKKTYNSKKKKKDSFLKNGLMQKKLTPISTSTSITLHFRGLTSDRIFADSS